MQVGRDHKLVLLQPVHNDLCLSLDGGWVLLEVVREIPVEIVSISVVSDDDDRCNVTIIKDVNYTCLFEVGL